MSSRSHWRCFSVLYSSWFSTSSIDDWEMSVEVSNYKYGFVYFSFQFCQFLLNLFWRSAVWCIHLRLWVLLGESILLSFHPLFIPGNFHYSEVYFGINIVIPAFIWLLFACVYLSCHFILALYLHLSEFLVDSIQLGYLKKIYSDISVSWLLNLEHLHLVWLLICLDLGLSFYYLFSAYFCF